LKQNAGLVRPLGIKPQWFIECILLGLIKLKGAPDRRSRAFFGD